MDTIATDNSFSENPFSKMETEMLATMVGMIIPASTRYGVPSAADEIILSDIIDTARQTADTIREGLTALDAAALNEHGASFLSLDHDTRTTIIEKLDESSNRFLEDINRFTLQCYYRDTRVMMSLGMEARPPFPIGYELEQGDWSLLDPVRDRGKIWRDNT